MKKIIFTFVLAVVASWGMAQSYSTETARIHLMYKGGDLPFKLKTTMNPQCPFKIKPQSYAVIETSLEEIGLIQELDYAEQAVSLHLKKGTDYYFRLAYISGSNTWNIDEISANAFKLELLANRINFDPKVYRLPMENTFQ